MNEQLTDSAAALRFPFPSAPAPGTLIDVAPRVKWLRMPLPFALDHINLWVLDDGASWTIVDTGINSSKTRELWDAVLAGPLREKPVGRVIVTHFHPDHVGLGGWLAEKCGVPLWMTEKECAAARFTHALTPEANAPLMQEQYTCAGLASALPDAMSTRAAAYTARVHPIPASIIFIDVAKPIAAAGTEWHVIVGEGHSPQLAALFAPALGVLISGDQVLPGISPNISVRASAPDSDPLREYLTSLPRYRVLPEETFVLPSHKLPFYGLRARIDQIVAHHEQRLDLAKRACRHGATAGDVLAALFPRQFDSHQLHFAIGETLAHLNYLVSRSEIKREAGAGGVDRYRLS